MDDHINGASAEIFANPDTRKVVTRFYHPHTGATVLELHLDPEQAREYALNLTRASITIEGD
jgi:hypothetical protein